MAHERLLGHVPLPAANIHRIPGEQGPEEGARIYAGELAGFFPGPWPTFDMVLLGMGSDGHTASLFSGSRALDLVDRPVAGVPVEEAGGEFARISLTVPAINHADLVIVLISGAEKAPMVHIALEGPPDRVPVQRIEPDSGRLTWLLDHEAASHLEGTRWHWGP
jgi:6-phosphogluconolactonase